MLFPLLPLYFQQLGFAPTQIGIIVSAHSLLSIPLAIPLGRFLDKYSPYLGISLGFLLNLISSILLILYNNFTIITLSQLIGGLGFSFIVIGAQAAISSLENFAKKATGFAKLALYGAIGQSLGPYLGGLIVDKFSFNLLFIISAILSIPGLLILFKKGSVQRQNIQKSKNTNGFFNNIKFLLKSKVILLILLFTGISVFVTTLRSSFLPIFLKDLNFKPDFIGMLISIFSIVMSLVRTFIAKFFKKYNLNNLIILTMLLFATGFIIIPITNNTILIAIGIILWGCAFGISQPLSMLMMSENIPNYISGLGMGIRFTAITCSAFLAPIIFGLIVEYISLAGIFYFSSVLCITFILLVILYKIFNIV